MRKKKQLKRDTFLLLCQYRALTNRNFTAKREQTINYKH